MPWLVSLLVGCGDDGGAESSTTGDTTSTSTAGSTSTADTSSSTSAGTSSDGSSSGSSSSGGSSGGSSESSTSGGPVVLDAVDDTYFTAQDAALPIDAGAGLSANDAEGEGGAAQVTAFDAVSVAGGAVDVAADGSFTYTPVAGFWGRDSFGYTVEDGLGATDSATVTVFVAPRQIPLGVVASGAGGFVLDGELAGDQSGTAVSGAGDVNGDGLDDLVVGARAADGEGSYAGRSYVVFGQADTTAVDLSMLGDGGFAVLGEAAYDFSGQAVNGAGDVNGDGLDDLVIGAMGSDANGMNSGRGYVVFGKADSAAVDLSALGDSGFVIDGETESDRAGISVAAAGDVDGDGLDDIVIGAYRSEPTGTYSGSAYVVFGKADSAAVDLSALGDGGFAIHGEGPFQHAGNSVSGAGDVDGDGLADVIIGAPYGHPNGAAYSGRSYVVFGKADTETVALATLGEAGFAIDGEVAWDFSGVSVSGAGDVDGDGLDDVIVGAPGADPNGERSGRSYVVFGKADSTTVALGLLGDDGFAIDGEVAEDFSGARVSGAGDVDGNGLADVIVGAWRNASNGAESGRSYVVFGKADTTTVVLSTLGDGGYVLDGEAAGDRSGTVHGAGDVDGDGLDDIIIGAAEADPAGDSSGRSYVVFGVPTGDNCCSAHGRGGCTDDAIEACVCEVDAACCTAEWDATCVGEATVDCGACG